MFTLEVSMDFDSEADQDRLNRACNPSVAAASKSTGNMVRSFFGGGGGGDHVSFFGSSSSSSTSISSSPTKAQAALEEKTKHCMFVASASSVELTMDYERNKKQKAVRMAALLVPPALIDNVLEKCMTNTKIHATGGSSIWFNEGSTALIASDLLPRIHASLTQATIRGIVRTSIASEQNAPAEVLLLSFTSNNKMDATYLDIATATEGESIVDSATPAIIKVLPLSTIHFSSCTKPSPKNSPSVRYQLPTCPVCIHRVEPTRLGLPRPKTQHLCSRFCPSPGLSGGALSFLETDVCPKQQLLRKWPPPARCTTCTVIHKYWEGQRYQNHGEETKDYDIFYCEQCSMDQTLWVCLTCGFVGCGRYSNKHSVAHFQETSHPFSLELATLRIWDYQDGDAGGYAHRPDLLDCPSSAPLAQPWSSSVAASAPSMAAYASPPPSTAAAVFHRAWDQDVGKTSKKAVMIGEEYEALLQSALEDQAHHYEGEMSRLRAELSASLMDANRMTPQEEAEINELKQESMSLRKQVESVSRHLVDLQAQEARHRATSQKLLREQQVANGVLAKVQDQAREEEERGTRQIEELEQQIADLTANLKMRHRLSMDKELAEADIVGTAGTENKTPGRRGKKKGKSHRK